jgi:hypothetical protein
MRDLEIYMDIPYIASINCNLKNSSRDAVARRGCGGTPARINGRWIGEKRRMMVPIFAICKSQWKPLLPLTAAFG